MGLGTFFEKFLNFMNQLYEQLYDFFVVGLDIPLIGHVDAWSIIIIIGISGIVIYLIVGNFT